MLYPQATAPNAVVNPTFGMGLGMGAGGAGPPAQSSLLAEYRFDATSGSVLKDYGPNGYTGTLAAGGAAPTWTSTGLQFVGASNQYVTLTNLPIASIRTVIFYGSETALAPYNVILSGNASNSLTWMVNNTTGGYRPSVGFWVGGVGEGQRSNEDTFQQGGGQSAAWVQNGTADQLYVNGWPCLNTTAGAGGNETSATGRTGTVLIGLNTANGALGGLTATAGGLLVYSTALPAAQIAQGHQYLAARASGRLMTPYASGFTGFRIWTCGDSITAGSTIVTPPYVTAAGLYNHSYTTINRAVTGNTAQRIAGGIRSRTLQQWSSAATRNILWLFAGTNDIAVNGTTAAATFAYLNQTVQYALAFGFQIVICPMLSRVGFDTQKNALNTLIFAAAAGWGSNVYVIQTASLTNLIGDGAYANGTYFNADGIHPLQTSSDSILAPAFAAGVNSFGP